MTEFVYATVNKHLGGEGSGFFGHAGRPGEVGGSGTGEADVYLAGMTDKSSRVDLPVMSGIAEGNRRGRFGDCTNLALKMHKESGAAVYVGSVIERSRYDRIKSGENIAPESMPHAWNVLNGKIVDGALGSRKAQKYLYFGEQVPDKLVATFRSGDDLARWHIEREKELKEQ